MSEIWHCLTVTLDTDAQDFENALTLLLETFGVDSINEQDSGTLDGKDLPSDKKRWLCYFCNDFDREAFDEQLNRIAEQNGASMNRVWSVSEDDSWKTNWKSWFKPAQISDRIAIRAPWIDFEALPGSEIIIIEPGMAFGTGLHETTQLCIREIDTLSEKHAFKNMLDVGCGSGVLAIAAKKVGIPDVYGVDNDPVAVEVSIENAAFNHVDARFDGTDIAEIRGTYELVVANIISGALIAMKEALSSHVAEEGFLVLSGILNTESDDVIEAFLSDSTLRMVDYRTMGEWTSLTFKKGTVDTP